MNNDPRTRRHGDRRRTQFHLETVAERGEPHPPLSEVEMSTLSGQVPRPLDAEVSLVNLGTQPFSAFRNLQSVPWARIFCGVDLISPTSCRRSAWKRIESSGSISRQR